MNVSMHCSSKILITLMVLFAIQLLVILLPTAVANTANPYYGERYEDTVDLFPIIFLLNFPINTVLYIGLLRWGSKRTYLTNVFKRYREDVVKDLLITTGLASVLGIFIDIIVSRSSGSYLLALILIFFSFALLSKHIMKLEINDCIGFGLIFGFYNATIWPLEIYHLFEDHLAPWIIVLNSALIISLIFLWRKFTPSEKERSRSMIPDGNVI